MNQRRGLVTALLLTWFAVMGVCAEDTASNLKYSKELRFQSEGSWLPALFYGAAGAGPHPTVILLHGYPGNEKNLDIAQGLRSAGYNVMFFHYRGAWGAEGEFGFLNAEADVQAAITFLTDSEQAEALRIDVERVSLVGHSMGGHMAIAGIQQSQDLQCAVAYDTANIGVTFAADSADGDTQELTEKERAWMAYGDSLFMLRGWSGAKSRQQAVDHRERLDLRNHVAGIGDRGVLLVAADSDVIPVARIENLAEAMKEAQVPVTYVLMKDDHSFNNHRAELLALTREFLDAHCSQ